MLAERFNPTPSNLLEPLYELTRAVASASRRETIYEAALESLRRVVGVERSSILLFDAAAVMRFVAWRGLSAGYRAAVEGHSPWEPGEPDPQPVVVPDVRLDPSLEELRPVVEEEGIRALAFIPLVVAGRLLGKFMLYHEGPHEFEPAELMAAQTIASQVAFAIDQRRAHEDRELAESERRAHRDHIDALFSSSVAGIVELDDRARFVVVNDRFCELTGRTRAELAGGLSLLEVTHPDDREATASVIAGLGDGDRGMHEWRLLRTDGSVVWVIASVSSVSNGRGMPVGAMAVVTDITKRRVAEELVAESERRYRHLLESVGVAVYTTNAVGEITLYNEEAAALWGRRPELGVDLWCGSWRIYNPDGTRLPHEDCPMGVALKENRPVRGVPIVAERPNGERAHVLPHPTPLRDADGNLIGAVNVLVDVTELKETQAALEAALRSKDDFLGQVSHELRNPLTQIGGFAQMLRRGGAHLTGDVRDEAVNEIATQAGRMQRLVDNMMVLSQLERDMLPPTEPMLLHHMAPETVDEFRRRFPGTAVNLTVTTADMPPVETSRGTIDQVLWNLLTNAQKYGPAAGPIDVEIRTAGEFLELVVADHGPGVSEDDIPRLFEPYYRSSTTPEHVAGLGLGLSVCRRLLEAQNGEIWARRGPQGGMEFGLRLKALEAEAPPEAS